MVRAAGQHVAKVRLPWRFCHRLGVLAALLLACATLAVLATGYEKRHADMGAVLVCFMMLLSVALALASELGFPRQQQSTHEEVERAETSLEEGLISPSATGAAASGGERWEQVDAQERKSKGSSDNLPRIWNSAQAAAVERVGPE
eukprot:TRINITY_DN100973_c0_g1_i1.p1 TRINITY_DN100973_c0_g1~~TRINITY_DN100973_c0_g1_i1.p1  ORF type:complete len:164 (+),score=45.20 TRINITY_DN100973_c0_g1_i1:57-494(+)